MKGFLYYLSALASLKTRNAAGTNEAVDQRMRAKNGWDWRYSSSIRVHVLHT